jgi:hypothetical protein
MSSRDEYNWEKNDDTNQKFKSYSLTHISPYGFSAIILYIIILLLDLVIIGFYIDIVFGYPRYIAIITMVILFFPIAFLIELVILIVDINFQNYLISRKE